MSSWGLSSTLLRWSQKTLGFWTRPASTIAKCMRDWCIVPEVIEKPPSKIFSINYAGGHSVNLGNELSPYLVKSIPCVKFGACHTDFYTLCMTDPDAPSRQQPTFREWHHWLVGNIPGGDVFKGETLSEYIGAAPPKGSGAHRYVFLIYQQPKELCFTEPRLTNCSAEGRPCFSIAKFARKYRLGDPIAGNFFQAEWDCYVPTIYRQLGVET